MHQRRLTVILAADVVGYSRLMGEDEAGTLEALKAHRDTLFDPEIKKRGGRTVKLMGDGVLVEFSSVVDAVEAAVAVQRALAQDEGPIQLRIGINLGDVIVDGEEIYGDGVNVAARLEAEAEPGGICIASIVHESIRNRVGANFRDAGKIDLKNIEHPVHAFHWTSEPVESVAKPLPAKSGTYKPRSSNTITIAMGLALLLGGGVAVLGYQMMQGADSENASVLPTVATTQPSELPSDESAATGPAEPEVTSPGEAAPTTSEGSAAQTAPAASTSANDEKPENSATGDESTRAAADAVAPEAPVEETPVPGGEIADLLTGKTLRGGAEFGGKRFALRLRQNGSFRGEISFDDAFGSGGVDDGRWLIRGDEFCVRFLVFASGRQVCAMVMRDPEGLSFKTPDGQDRKWTLGE